MVNYTYINTKITSIPLLKLLYLFCTNVYTGQSNKEASNFTQKNTFGFRPLQERTGEIAAFYAKENEENFHEKLENMNEISVVSYTFLEDDEKEMESAIVYIADKFAKNGFFDYQRLYVYMQTGSNLLYWDYEESIFKKIKNATLEEKPADEDSTEYRIINETEEAREAKRRNAESEIPVKARLKEDKYEIRFATEMKRFVKDNDNEACYIKFRIDPCYKIFNQVINCYRVVEFTDGLIGYYSSYLFKFKIAKFYNKKEAEIAKKDFIPHSLEVLRKNSPEWYIHINDVSTIAEDIKWDGFITNVIGSLPIISWINDQRLYASFLSLGAKEISEKEMQEKEILQIVHKLRTAYSVNMTGFFAIVEIIREGEKFISSFLQDLLKELENVITDLYEDDEQCLEINELINRINKRNDIYVACKEQKPIKELKTWIKNLLYLLKYKKFDEDTKNAINSRFISIENKLRQEYTRLRETQIKLIERLKEIISVDLYTNNNENFLRSKDNSFNELIKKINQSINSISYDMPNGNCAEGYDSLTVILDDMIKNLTHIEKIVEEYFEDHIENTEEEINSIIIKNLLNICNETVGIITHRPDAVCVSKYLSFVAQLHILICSQRNIHLARIYAKEIWSTTISRKPFDSYDFTGLNMEKLKITGKKYQSEVNNQLNSLKKFLDINYDSYIASKLMRRFEKIGDLPWLNYLLNRDHILGNFRDESIPTPV